MGESCPTSVSARIIALPVDTNSSLSSCLKLECNVTYQNDQQSLRASLGQIALISRDDALSKCKYPQAGPSSALSAPLALDFSCSCHLRAELCTTRAQVSAIAFASHCSCFRVSW